MRTEKSEVHSITGFFVESHSPQQSKYFGGFLTVRTSPNEPREGVLSMPFNGFLIDYYGRSKIEGEISPSRLFFNKLYQDRGYEIMYDFKINNGIWVGEYSFNHGEGYSEAKTHLDWPNLEMIAPMPFDPEEYSRDLINRMVDNGIIDVVENDGIDKDSIF